MPKNARARRQKRDGEGLQFIVSRLQDPDYVGKFMPYAMHDSELVATKFSEAIYRVRSGYELLPLVESFIANARVAIPFSGLRFANVFLMPYPTVVSLPNGYVASRVDQSSQSAVSIGIFNFIAHVSAGEESTPIGVAYLLAGHFSVEEPEVSRTFERSLSYTNDVLTALKATRHDHQITTLTAKTLPSHLDFYQANLDQMTLSEPQRLSLSAHDLVDVWAKRLPEAPEILQEFAVMCEGLVLRPEVRYLLDLMADCVTHFCLGRYERTILDSDRFAELSFRLCFVRNGALKDYDINQIKRLYHPDAAVESILGLLMEALKLPKTDLIRQWFGRARKPRNRIAHDLDFSVATGNVAMEALKYNMNAVDYIVSGHSSEDWDILLLRKGAALVHGLFEAPSGRKPGSKS